MNHSVRIIGGTYRGKTIHFPQANNLRPTPARVRETLFNWLMNRIRNYHCLDVFAGSGALGFEAYSRGATHVTFIEQVPEVIACLHQEIASFNTSQLQLIAADALTYLQKPRQPVDLIFLDPPFKQELIPICLNHIVASHLLKPQGLVYWEAAQPIDVNNKIWQTIKLKKAGQVYYGLLARL